MTVRAVSQLLAVSDMRLWRTLDRYLEQARAQRHFSAVTAVGLNETAARRRHDCDKSFARSGAAVRFLIGREGPQGCQRYSEDSTAQGVFESRPP